MDKLQGQVKPVSGYYSLQPNDNNSYIVTDALVATQIRIPPLFYNKDYPVGYIVTIINQGEPAEIILPDDVILTVPNGTTLSEPGQQCIIVKTDTLRWLVDVIKAGGGGGGDYVLPTASANVKGGIKIGKNLTINPDQTLDAPAAIPGPAGKDGKDGKDGQDGLQGPKGEPGPQGEKGIQGDSGAQGPAGKDGIDGKDGAQGPKGDNGDVGPKGDKGDAGAQGQAGKDGAQGPKGDTGAQGIQGIKGDKGDKGDAGGGSIEIQDSGITITKQANKINFIGDVAASMIGDTVIIAMGAVNRPSMPTNLAFNSVDDKMLATASFTASVPTSGDTLDYYLNRVNGVYSKLDLKDATHFTYQCNKPNSETGIQIQAVTTKGYISEFSNTCILTTKPAQPIITNVVASTAQLQLFFKPNSNDGTVKYTNYYYQFKTASDDTGLIEFKVDNITAGVYTGTISDIPVKYCEKDVTITIVIKNIAGQSIASTPNTIIIPGVVPSAPSEFKLGVVNQSNVATLTFKPSIPGPGQTITKYEINDYLGIREVAITKQELGYDFINVTYDKANYPITASIRATSNIGLVSNWSSSINFATLPEEPLIQGATGGVGEINVIFLPNPANGPEPITGYTYFLRNAKSAFPRTLDFTPIDLGGGKKALSVKVDAAYWTNDVTINIQLLNKYGAGMSSKSVVNILPEAPATPTNITASVNNSKLCIVRFDTITIPNDTIDYYNVKIDSISQKVNYRLYDTKQSEVSFNVNDYNQNYKIQLQVVSKGGLSSEWSVVKTVTAPPAPPVIETAYGSMARTVSALIKANPLDKNQDYDTYSLILQGTYGSSPKFPATRIEITADDKFDVDFANIPAEYCENNVVTMIAVSNSAGYSSYQKGPTININKG